jgi:hypothetical protein
VAADTTTSASEEWWTRSQRIRTVALLPVDLVLRVADRLPKYQVIAARAVHLRRLGLRNVRIASLLGVDDKTVAKAIAWITRSENLS